MHAENHSKHYCIAGILWTEIKFSNSRKVLKYYYLQFHIIARLYFHVLHMYVYLPEHTGMADSAECFIIEGRKGSIYVRLPYNVPLWKALRIRT